MSFVNLAAAHSVMAVATQLLTVVRSVVTVSTTDLNKLSLGFGGKRNR